VIDFLSEYSLFLAKAITVVLAILATAAGIIVLSARGKMGARERIEVKNLNRQYDKMKHTLQAAMMPKKAFQKVYKAWRKAEQKRHVSPPEERKKKIFVVNFHGDIRALAVSSLCKEITAILTVATPQDEVVLRLESAGGVIHGYGLAASQLRRIKDKHIPLTIAVDKVAASGGYMMACVADKIVASPFAILGSIGVVAQIPNFHRLLKKHDVDVEILTAGEHKRTLTIFGENTDKGREKFKEDIEDTHTLFKEFVSEHRPKVDIVRVATGEIWFGRRALEVKLVDQLQTSDEYLLNQYKEADIFEVTYSQKKSLPEKLGLAAQVSVDRFLLRWWERLHNSRWF
jgi:serine protease SohB